MTKVSKVSKNIVGEILDQESGKFVDITADMQRHASYVHNQVLMGAFISAVSIKKMFDDKLFLGMNCSSRDEYIDTMLPFGRRQAYKLYQVANKFDAVSQSLTGNGLVQIGSGDTSEIVQSTALEGKAPEISSIGIEKLYELTKLEDDDLKDLIKKGKIKIDGADVTIEDIKDTTAKELSRILKESTQKYKSKIAQQGEDINLLKEEMKSNEKELARLRKKDEDLDLIQKQYGPMATLIGQKKNYLNDAEKYLDIFQKIFINAGITEDDPEALRQHCQDIVRKIDQYHKNATDNYINVFVE
jgi:polyhydroxyalkanoate synthesis regulator phasin